MRRTIITTSVLSTSTTGRVLPGTLARSTVRAHVRWGFGPVDSVDGRVLPIDRAAPDAHGITTEPDPAPAGRSCGAVS